MKKRNSKLLAMLFTFCVMLSMFSTLSSAAVNLPTPRAKITAYTTPALKVSWDAITNANMYYVYRSKGNETKMTVVAKTSKLYYKDTDIVKNVVYSYKIKALNIKGGKTKGTSALSTAVKKAVVDVSIPTNVKARTVSNSQIKLSWNKVSGADKYNLYYSTKKDGTYTSIGYTKNTNYTFSKLTSSTTYYFKVKASKTLDGKNYTSKYSSIASAKTQAKAGDHMVEFKALSNKEAGIPTGSAINCLSILLEHYGIETSITNLVKDFDCSTKFYYDEKKRLWGPDPSRHFIGDPYSNKMYYAGTDIVNIERVMKKYTEPAKICRSYEFYNTYWNFDENKKFFDEGNIVLALISKGRIKYDGYFEWVCYDSRNRELVNMYDTEARYVIICGYTDDKCYIIYDPYSDKIERIKADDGLRIFSWIDLKKN